MRVCSGETVVVMIDEGAKRVADCLEGLSVGEVGVGEGVTLLNRGLEETATVETERYRREIVELGGCATHGINYLLFSPPTDSRESDSYYKS